MQNTNPKEKPLFSIILGALSFLLGFFIIYLIAKHLQKKEEKENLFNDIEGNVGEENNGSNYVRDFSVDLNERQNRILMELKCRGEISPSEIYRLQPNVSTRTIRRDMDVLVKAGIVRQDGNTKSTKYIYVG